MLVLTHQGVHARWQGRSARVARGPTAAASRAALAAHGKHSGGASSTSSYAAGAWRLRAAACRGLPPPSAAAAGAAAAQPAPRAQDVRPIQLQQQLAALTADGLVPCTASLAAVPAELRPLLEAAVAAYRRCLGGRLLGVYLRGSLVQPGCFVPGLSDADFVALATPEGSSSTAGGGPEAADGAAAALRQAAAELRAAFPQCAKVRWAACPHACSICVTAMPHDHCAMYEAAALTHSRSQAELKVVALPPASPLAALARRRPTSVPPAALAGAEGLCFTLKTQAASLHGWDLPATLPDVAALPPLQLLPSLVEDVEAAAAAARQRLAASDGSGSGVEMAAAAARWALKRCLRAAFELHLCCSEGGGAGGAGGRVFTRDLYWCWRYAAAQHPELAPQLEAALQLYVQLGSSSDEGSGGSSGGGSSTASSSSGALQKRAESGARLAQQLAAAVDAAFLQRMLAEEPGWLAHHRDPAVRSSSSSTTTSSGSSKASSKAGGWAQQMRLKLWLAGATASGGSLEDGVLGAPPPPVTAPVCGGVLTLDWRQPEQRQRALALIAAMGSDPTAPLASGAGASSSSSGSLPDQPQPVLLKGAAAHWPAVQRWTLAGLAAAGLQGRARLAPSLHFPFTEPRLAALLAERRGALAPQACLWYGVRKRCDQNERMLPGPPPLVAAGPAALPSAVARMSAGEFAARLARGNPCGLPPLVYGAPGGSSSSSSGGSSGVSGSGEEYLYWQAELPPALQRDVDLAALAPPGQRPSQAARVWVGPRGAVSPTHYDTSLSFLAQARGRCAGVLARQPVSRLPHALVGWRGLCTPACHSTLLARRVPALLAAGSACCSGRRASCPACTPTPTRTCCAGARASTCTRRGPTRLRASRWRRGWLPPRPRWSRETLLSSPAGESAVCPRGAPGHLGGPPCCCAAPRLGAPAACCACAARGPAAGCTAASHLLCTRPSIHPRPHHASHLVPTQVGALY